MSAAEAKFMSFLLYFLVNCESAEIVMAEKTVQFSIDLVEAALKHRQFLQLVDAYPSLYAGPHVQNAIRRCVYFKLGS